MEKLSELNIYNQLLCALGRDRTCPQWFLASQVGRALHRIAHDSSCSNETEKGVGSLSLSLFLSLARKQELHLQLFYSSTYQLKEGIQLEV